MRIAVYDNSTGGVIYREETAEEQAEREEKQAAWESEEHEPAEPTTEERIAALEEQLVAAKILLGVE